MRLFKFLARSVLAITLAGVPTKANAQSIDELYQAAKKEGALSLNGGGLAGLYEPWVREFERRFPGIKVKLTADFSNILAPIIDREIAERKLSVDLTIFQTLQDYDRWKKLGVLLSFRPEGWDRFPEVGIQRQSHHGLSERRRCHALSVLYDCSEIRLGVHGQVYGEQPAVGSRTLGNRSCRGQRPSRSDLRHYDQRYAWFEKEQSANRRRFFERRSSADLAANDGDLQGRPTPERRQTLHYLVPGEGTAKPNRHLVDTLGCPSTVRSQADIRVSTCR